jgi:hypothetical protein
MSQDEPDGKCEPIASQLLPLSEQVGRNVLEALRDPDAVAVITTMIPGITADRVVSLGLTPDQMAEVQELLERISEEDEETASDEQRCIGFQCRVEKA